jgi:hypothetical protein
MKTIRTSTMNNMNIVNILGVVIHDGTIIEAVYHPKWNRAALLVKATNDDAKFMLEYEAYGKIFRPLVDDAIIKGRVLLPDNYIQEVNPLDLLEEIRTTIRRYVDLEPIYEIIASRYILMTWVYDRFHRIPYLRILGPWASGKTRFLSVMAAMAYHSSRLGVGLTPANIYRWLDNYPGTLILDEADFPRTSQTSMITQILNGGYDRDGAVFRCEPGNGGLVSTAFNAFGPKIMASRRQFDDDALETRFLTLVSRQMRRDDIPLSLPAFLEWTEMTRLRNLLLGYRVGWLHRIDPMQPIENVDRYGPRFVELLTPLIASAMENELTDELEEFALQQYEDQKAHISLGDEGILVEVILSLSSLDKPPPTVKEIAQEVNKRRGRQYPLTPKKLGGMIRGLGLQTHRIKKGYVLIHNPAQLMMLSRRYGIQWNPEIRLRERFADI